MSLPPSVMLPEVGVSRPATIRRVVVLPQPEGPRRAKNEPVGTSRSSDFTAVNAANCLVRLRSCNPPETLTSVAREASATCDIGKLPFVLSGLLVVEHHEVERVLEVFLGGEDQRVVDERVVDLDHRVLSALHGTDVVDVRRQLRCHLGLVVEVDPL